MLGHDLGRRACLVLHHFARLLVLTAARDSALPDLWDSEHDTPGDQAHRLYRHLETLAPAPRMLFSLGYGALLRPERRHPVPVTDLELLDREDQLLSLAAAFVPSVWPILGPWEDEPLGEMNAPPLGRHLRDLALRTLQGIPPRILGEGRSVVVATHAIRGPLGSLLGSPRARTAAGTFFRALEAMAALDLWNPLFDTPSAEAFRIAWHRGPTEDGVPDRGAVRIALCLGGWLAEVPDLWEIAGASLDELCLLGQLLTDCVTPVDGETDPLLSHMLLGFGLTATSPVPTASQPS